MSTCFIVTKPEGKFPARKRAGVLIAEKSNPLLSMFNYYLRATKASYHIGTEQFGNGFEDGGAMQAHRLTTIVPLMVLTLALSPAWPDDARAGVPTPCEAGGGNVTPRYAETMAWCFDLARGSDLLHLDSFGVSGEGRALPVVVADRRGRFLPEHHTARGDRVVVLVQACIHAGESCGKDAGLALLRDLAADPALAARLLGNTTLVFIPIFNVDGHERFGPYNRPNQNGPVEMGWRVTAGNLNLNRDFLKADTPEMRAWLELFNAWDPDFFIDIHSTDGADYQYALTYGLELHGNLEAGLTTLTADYRDAMEAALSADGVPIAPYLTFRNWHDPRSGLEAGVMGPRFSQGYAAVRNRPGLLIETHMLKDYPTRVEASRLMVVRTLEWLAVRGGALRAAVAGADAFTAGAAFRAEPFPLRFGRTDVSRPFPFLGVAYDQVTSPVTGGQWFRYHSDRPETMTVEIFDDLAPKVTARLPEAYVVPRQWAAVIDRLRAHGVVLTELAEPVELDIRTWRLADPKWRERPYEGHHPVTFRAEPVLERRMFPAGSVLVDLAQPLARVAAHLLEPEGPDALVGWGFLDAIFERVEYVESYVIEEMIADMTADDPDLLRQLEQKKAADPAFAADPWAIRNWFYEKTPYGDSRVGIYPIGCLDDRAVVQKLGLK